MDKNLFAAVDLGTNNCRLLVAKSMGSKIRIIDAYSRIVRLGEGLSQNGMLSQKAMKRTLQALQVCENKIKQREVGRVRYVATAVCRKAQNCNEFVSLVNERIGINLEVITAEEEAVLALLGCAPIIDPLKKYALVFDIGGGSIEVVWAALNGSAYPDIKAWISLPIGVVTLSEEFGGYEHTSKSFVELKNFVINKLISFEEDNNISHEFNQNTAQMIGTSGTMSTLAAVHLNLSRYNRSVIDGRSISSSELLITSNKIKAMKKDTLIAHPCILKGRADLVVPGCSVLEAILTIWPASNVSIADRGIREGMLRKMMSMC